MTFPRSNFFPAKVFVFLRIFQVPKKNLLGFLTLRQFSFSVIDESRQRGDTSPEQKFYIRVLSGNVKGPLFPNAIVNITVRQGNSIPVPPEYLKVSDPDSSPQDLRYRMTKGPQEGRLVFLTDGSQVDVQEGVDTPHDQFIGSAYRYVHNGQNIDDDHIVIECTDGKHTGTLQINVFVIPAEKKAPELDGGTLNMELAEGLSSRLLYRFMIYPSSVFVILKYS